MEKGAVKSSVLKIITRQDVLFLAVGLRSDTKVVGQSSRYEVNGMPNRIDILPDCQTSRPAEQMEIQTDRCTARYAYRYATEQAPEQLTRLSSFTVPRLRCTVRQSPECG